MGKFAKLQFIIGAKTAQLQRDMKKANGIVGKFKTAITSLGGIMAAAFAVAGISRFVKKVSEAADVQLKAEASLLTALKGREDAQQRLIKQAQDLQKITLYGDEETIAAQSYLAQMGLEEQAITRLIPLIQDMATAKGMDLKNAADLVAKSVGSSTNALSRYGIEITGAVGSSERLESAVTALNDKFADQAAVAAKTGTGPLTQLRNAWGDIMEDMGKVLIPILAKVATWLADKLPKAVDFIRTSFRKLRLTTAGMVMGLKGVAIYAAAAGYALAHPLRWKEIGFRFDVAKQKVDALGKGYEDLKRRLSTPITSTSNLPSIFDAGGAGGGFTPTTIKTTKKEDPVAEQLRARAKEVERLEGREQLLMNAVNARAAAEENAIKFSTGLKDADIQRTQSTLNLELATSGLSAATQFLNEISNITAMNQEDRAEAFRDAAQRIVSSFIAEGVASIVKDTLVKAGGALGPLAIPIAAAAGAGASALFNAAIPKFAMGGIVPPGFPNDNYPALLSSGETVVPKPKALGAMTSNVKVTGAISGEVIRLSTARANYRYNRIVG